MTPDVLTRLERLAPDLTELEARWSAEQRAELALRIVGDDLAVRGPRSWRARVAALGVAAAAAIAAILVVPSLLPQGTPGGAAPAAADALHRLARVAAGTPADTFRPGQFVHTVTTSHQVGVPENPELGPVVSDVRTERWTAYDGRSWFRHTSPGVARPDTYVEKADGDNGAAHHASLPTDPDALGRYLRRHVHGSSSRDEAVFLAVGDLMADDTAPAALRSAAAEALARTPHVRLGPETTDSLGRTVVEFDFVDESIRPGTVQTFLVDPATAQVIGQGDTQPGSTYGQTLVSSDVVDAVPADILASACPVNGPIC